MAITGDTLGVSISGLLAFQRALATTSHNVANVNTDGYSRQRVELAARPPQQAGNGFIGAGVEVVSVRRVYDDFLTRQVRTGTAANGELQQYFQLASRVDDLLADPNAGLAPTLQNFFNAVQGVTNDPSSIPARQVMLSQGKSLADRFHYLDQRLADLRGQVNTELKNDVTEINAQAAAIAKLNQEIVRSQGATANPPNDLLDQRDAAIAKLAQKIAVTTVPQDDGALNVFIGNGQTLVIGDSASTLTVAGNPYDATRLEVAYTAGASSTIISNSLNGGALGGALRFRNEILDPAQNALGRVATGLALTFNPQHREGMDLSGALGGDFFVSGVPAVFANSQNTGTGSVTATISNAGAMTTSDYSVRFNGAGSWTVTRLSDNTAQTGAGPFSIDGLTIAVGGAPAIGDSFLLQPTRGGAKDIGVAIADPRLIAAAAPIRARTAAANTGNAAISSGEVLDVTDPNLLNTVTINFVDAGNYQINGAGPLIAYASGANIDLNGWRVQISGTPAAGDVFTVEPNTGGAGDNRNALLLAGLQTGLTLANNSATYNNAYGQLVADVGSAAHSADISRAAQESLLNQATQAREAGSGVNLDEEAADMTRFQQAYQAAAQLVAVSDTLFQTLLGAVRR